METLGTPPTITAAKTAVRSADGLLIATPEYNGSFSGVLKNAIDWLSRPWGDSPLTDKPVVTLSAAPGAGGGRKALAGLREVLDELGAAVVPADSLTLPHSYELIDRGEISDPRALAAIAALVSTLLEHCTGTGTPATADLLRRPATSAWRDKHQLPT